MIVIDTSALIAIVQGEPTAPACIAAISAHDDLLIAGPTLAECLIVAMGRRIEEEMRRLLEDLLLSVVPLTGERAHDAAEAYRRWGKGRDPAGLNICDTFAYALAMENECPLLFVGDDFAKTDVAKAL